LTVSQKSDPKINLKSPAMMRKFWSLNPENLHQEKILLNDSLGSYGYRCMNVYESHTLLMIDKKDRRIWVKFHFKIQHGNKPLYGPQHLELKGKALKPVQKSND
jgi:catalase